MKVKKFNESLREPKVGDYVYCKPKVLYYTPIMSEAILDFLSNIGVITEIKSEYKYKFPGFPYTVRYKNIPYLIRDYFGSRSRCFDRDEILEFDEDLETLKVKINAKKYNL